MKISRGRGPWEYTTLKIIVIASALNVAKYIHVHVYTGYFLFENFVRQTEIKNHNQTQYVYWVGGHLKKITSRHIVKFVFTPIQ